MASRVRTAGWLALLLLAGGCDLARVIAHNARWYFHTPAPAPRRDVPSTSDAELSVLWVGHATALVQIHDRFVITDPVFSETVGGLSRRLVAAGLDPAAVPSGTVALVSHRHFDHLSKDSLTALDGKLAAVVVPPGAAADVPRGAVELAAWHSWEDRGLRVTAVPAAHDGNRWLHDARSHPRAFTGFVVEYRGVVVYFGGDTAYRAEMFAAIAARFPRIDLALVPLGPIAPERMMLAHHMNPEQAVQALADLGAEHGLAIHFATFLHSFDEPGDCERRFDAALSRSSLAAGRVRRLEAGERWLVRPTHIQRPTAWR